MIVENKKQLKEFIKKYKSEDSILIPVFCDDNKHPIETEISVLYVLFMDEQEYILPFNHSETLNIEIPDLNSKAIKYTYDRKLLNHFVKLDNVIDVNFIHYMATGVPLDIEQIDTNAHYYFHTKHYKKSKSARSADFFKAIFSIFLRKFSPRSGVFLDTFLRKFSRNFAAQRRFF